MESKLWCSLSQDSCWSPGRPPGGLPSPSTRQLAATKCASLVPLPKLNPQGPFTASESNSSSLARQQSVPGLLNSDPRTPPTPFCRLPASWPPPATQTGLHQLHTLPISAHHALLTLLLAFSFILPPNHTIPTRKMKFKHFLFQEGFLVPPCCLLHLNLSAARGLRLMEAPVCCP